MNKRQSEIDYYTVRLTETERQVLTAVTDTARSSYGELASLYRAHLKKLRGTAPDRGSSMPQDEGSRE